MLNSQRIFVQAIRNYCAEHGLAADVRADGWLVVMQDGARRKLAFAYDLGLNSAVAHRIRPAARLMGGDACPARAMA
jgi:hypothetical protein